MTFGKQLDLSYMLSDRNKICRAYCCLTNKNIQGLLTDIIYNK